MVGLHFFLLWSFFANLTWKFFLLCILNHFKKDPEKPIDLRQCSRMVWSMVWSPAKSERLPYFIVRTTVTNTASVQGWALKPDWNVSNILLLSINSVSCRKPTFSKILLINGRFEIGLKWCLLNDASVGPLFVHGYVNIFFVRNSTLELFWWSAISFEKSVPV